MSKTITVTATVACWANASYGMRNLSDALHSGNAVSAANALSFYGAPEMEKFGDWIRVGEADITMRLIPKDEQTARIVQALQKQLAEERVKWHERQEAILAEISKHSALTMDAVEA
jgi:hypothetical protein